MIRVLIAGEGENEIGRVTHPGHREPRLPADEGVIETLLGKVRSGGWEVRAALQWKDVHKLKPKAFGEGDAKTIQGLVLRARELGCNALIFLRDRDGDRPRERSIRDTCKNLPARPQLLIAGGVPVEMLESWLLSLRGETRAESEPFPAVALEDRHGIPQKNTKAMVQLVRNAKLLTAPADAASLWRWLRRVAVCLEVRIPSQWP